MAKFKNWKSTLAFLIFIGVYVYSIKTSANYQIVSVTGYIALYSSIFMMFRSDFTSGMIDKLVDKITFKKSE